MSEWASKHLERVEYKVYYTCHGESPKQAHKVLPENREERVLALAMTAELQGDGSSFGGTLVQVLSLWKAVCVQWYTASLGQVNCCMMILVCSAVWDGVMWGAGWIIIIDQGIAEKLVPRSWCLCVYLQYGYCTMPCPLFQEKANGSVSSALGKEA